MSRIYYKIYLTTDSDCLTCKNGEEYPTDHEIYETGTFTKSNKNRVLNKILKELKATEYKADLRSGSVINGVFKPSKLHIPEIMYDLKKRLMNILEGIKKTDIESINPMVLRHGGNQEMYVMIDLI